MIYLLLVLYQIKHFLCDYPLQGRYMLGKFKPYPDFIMPLLAHSATHGIATFLIALAFKPKIAFLVALFDMIVHFVVDRLKASPDMLGRFKPLTSENYKHTAELAVEFPRYGVSSADIIDAQKKIRSNTYFWWALGADQMAHHLTHYIIIWSLL